MEISNYILEKWEKWNNHKASTIDICILAGYFRISKDKLVNYDNKAKSRMNKKIDKIIGRLQVS